MKNNSKSIISFIAIILGFFMSLLDSTIVSITLPKMTAYFNTSLNQISWVTNGYNLAFAVMIITAARLSDQFGRKKLFMGGVFLFTIASLLSGLSSSVNMLIFFRVIQGLSAAFIVPVTVPLAVDLFPREKTGMIVGLWGAIAGLAAASGPALGGILTQFISWQSIFYINVPLGIFSLLLTAIYINESYDPSADKNIDFLGIITLSASVFCIVLSMIKVTDFGWTSPFTLTLDAISFVCIIVFLVNELKTKNPMLPLEIFKIRPFSFGALALFILGIGIMSGSFFLSFFLVQVKGFSQLKAGLIIAVMPLSSMFFSIIVGIFSSKVKGNIFSSIGLAALSLACYLYSSLTQNSSNFDLIWRLIICGAGMGFSMSSLMSSSIKSIPANKVGMSSGINNMTRTLGTVLGVAIFVTIFSSNIKLQMINAKEAAIDIVQKDTVFDKNAKQQIISSLKQASSDSNSENKSLDAVLSQVDTKEKSILNNSPEKYKAKIKESFELQKKETKKVWPLIQDTFSTYVVKAFSHTFKIGSLILLSGVIFALFSEKVSFRTI